MKINKFYLIFFVVFVMFFFMQNNNNVYAQSTVPKTDQNSMKNTTSLQKDFIDKIISELEVLKRENQKKTDEISELKKYTREKIMALCDKGEIEQIAFDIFKQRFDDKNEMLEHSQWLVMVIMAAFPLILVATGLYQYFQINKHAKNTKLELDSLKNEIESGRKDVKHENKSILQKLLEDTKQAQDELENRVDELRNEIEKRKKEASNLIQNSLFEQYYSVSSHLLHDVNLGKTEHNIRHNCLIALSYLNVLYENGYQLLVVCRHIGVCHKYLKNFDEALKYLMKTKELAFESGKDSMEASILREIEQIRKLKKENHSPTRRLRQA